VAIVGEGVEATLSGAMVAGEGVDASLSGAILVVGDGVRMPTETPWPEGVGVGETAASVDGSTGL